MVFSGLRGFSCKALAFVGGSRDREGTKSSNDNVFPVRYDTTLRGQVQRQSVILRRLIFSVHKKTF